jgi:hypothetical protein
MSIFSGLAPWIVYWILVGNVSFRTAVLIAFGASIVVFVHTIVNGERPKVLEIGSMVVFAIVTVITLTTDDHFLEQWIQPITNGGLFVIALASVLVHQPFTLQYAREGVPAEVAESPGFIAANYKITWVWIAAFGVMFVSSLIPPIFQGEATIHDGASTLSIVFYWVIPYGSLALAVLYTERFRARAHHAAATA